MDENDSAGICCSPTSLLLHPRETTAMTARDRAAAPHVYICWSKSKPSWAKTMVWKHIRLKAFTAINHKLNDTCYLQFPAVASRRNDTLESTVNWAIMSVSTEDFDSSSSSNSINNEQCYMFVGLLLSFTLFKDIRVNNCAACLDSSIAGWRLTQFISKECLESLQKFIFEGSESSGRDVH